MKRIPPLIYSDCLPNGRSSSAPLRLLKSTQPESLVDRGLAGTSPRLKTLFNRLFVLRCPNPRDRAGSLSDRLPFPDHQFHAI